MSEPWKFNNVSVLACESIPVKSDWPSNVDPQVSMCALSKHGHSLKKIYSNAQPKHSKWMRRGAAIVNPSSPSMKPSRVRLLSTFESISLKYLAQFVKLKCSSPNVIIGKDRS